MKDKEHPKKGDHKIWKKTRNEFKLEKVVEKISSIGFLEAAGSGNVMELEKQLGTTHV